MFQRHPLISRIAELEGGAIHRPEFTVDMLAIRSGHGPGFTHSYTALGIRHDWPISQALGDG
jgi:hypothetical protein